MSLPLPLSLLSDGPPTGPREASDPVANARAARLAELVRELLPAMRRRASHLSERALADAVERIAAHRLADEELAHNSW